MTETTFKKSTAREYFESLVITVILALFGTTFIIQAFKIPTPSMEDNLLVGDHLLVNKFMFGAKGSILDWILPFKDIRRGDVIVFKYPKELELDPPQLKHYVKRAIGLPGDRIRIADKQVFVNGQPLKEPYKIHRSSPGEYASPQRDWFPPKLHSGRHSFDEDPDWYGPYVEGDQLVVPPGMYFAMGDNRDNSFDSRFWGFVPRENILGKALIIYWSYETPPDEEFRTDVTDRAQQFTDLFLNFFRKTRWSRTLNIIR